MQGLVEGVKAHPKNAEWRVITVGGKDFIAFSAALADALEKGKPLPEGTTEEPPKFEGAMPSLRLPRPRGAGGGGATAWRNTKEGAEFEQRNRRAWQGFEEERRDRRTALMQAVQGAGPETYRAGSIIEVADSFYGWLRQTLSPGAGNMGPGGLGTVSPGESSTSVGEGEAPAEDRAGGAVSNPAPARYLKAANRCEHTSGIDQNNRCTDCGKPMAVRT